MAPGFPGLPPVRRWVRRLVPGAFAITLVTAAVMTMQHDVHKPARANRLRPAPHFVHRYPADPIVPERTKVRGPSPKAPRADEVTGGRTMSSFADFAGRLPGGVLRHIRGAWLLSRPASVSGTARLIVRGPANLLIGPGAFLLATHGGTIGLTHVRVTGVGSGHRALKRPVRSRGFIVATSGGRLILRGDHILDLGHLGVQAYGVSMEKPARGSTVVGCTVDSNYFGIYVTHAVGVRIVRNTVRNSVVYGIDPHTESSRIVVERNRVIHSGVHGIVLAARVTRSLVRDNVVDGAGLHGIVVFDRSNRNRIVGNRISHTFDGIVVTDSSTTRITGNRLEAIRRFGVRISGRSNRSLVRGNRFDRVVLGVYVYGGAWGSVIQRQVFRRDGESVRVRVDAPGTTVRPLPPRSEVPV